MRNGWAAPPRPARAAPAALALLLAWVPALAFLGHWPADPLTPGDPHVALVALHTHPPGAGFHTHAPVTRPTSADPDAVSGHTAHADHGHGGGIATAFAAVVPDPVAPRALNAQPVARPLAQERAPAATVAPPPVPPPPAAAI